MTEKPTFEFLATIGICALERVKRPETRVPRALGLLAQLRRDHLEP
jgi:hypothetical protein